MAEPCWLMMIPPELRLKIYRTLFRNFALQISDEKQFEAHDAPLHRAANQLCKVSKQIRFESIPTLSSSIKVIAATVLLPQKNGEIDITIKPQLVNPYLNPAFRSSIQGISVSLQSLWIPDHREFPNLKKIAVDAWLVG